MARRYHVDPLPPAGRLVLPAEVAHHVARVMRGGVGDPICLFDGQGHECDGTIAAITGHGSRLEVSVEIGPHRAAGREPRTRITVAFPPPKGNREEWVFEHGTEIGIATFQPIVTARSVGSRRSNREERWRRLLAAATGQCDRGRIPRLSEPVDLDALLDDPNLPAERYVADLCGPPLGAATTESALLLVGPEGGLTEAELDRAERHDFQKRSLGVTTLRTETAVIAGAVLLLQGDHGTE